MDRIERAARKLCKAHGHDPDFSIVVGQQMVIGGVQATPAVPAQPAWTLYVGVVKLIADALGDPVEA